eukprot:UN08172
MYGTLLDAAKKGKSSRLLLMILTNILYLKLVLKQLCKMGNHMLVYMQHVSLHGYVIKIFMLNNKNVGLMIRVKQQMLLQIYHNMKVFVKFLLNIH